MSTTTAVGLAERAVSQLRIEPEPTAVDETTNDDAATTERRARSRAQRRSNTAPQFRPAPSAMKHNS
jgi:hypothetical protein